MTKPFLLYGATGYTGTLIAELAKSRGVDVVLAARNADALRPIAERLGMKHVAFTLDDTNALDKALLDVEAVLHCAGPFSRTSRKMVDACLRTGRHYLDITGEIPVFEACAARTSEARAKKIALIPGVGFDVVPSDCMAAHVKRRLPSATSLELCIASLGRLSHGTASTFAEHMAEGGAIRRNHAIVPEPAAKRSRIFDLGDGKERVAVSMPWGDVSTAWHSTKIPDITVYFALPRSTRIALRASSFVPKPLLRSRRVRNFVQSRIPSGGPNEAERARSRSVIVAEARDGSNVVTSRLNTPDGYALTADTALRAMLRVLVGGIDAGFLTPSLAFGPDFVLEADGVSRVDV